MSMKIPQLYHKNNVRQPSKLCMSQKFVCFFSLLSLKIKGLNDYSHIVSYIALTFGISHKIKSIYA